jgi:hypothetical protein
MISRSKHGALALGLALLMATCARGTEGPFGAGGAGGATTGSNGGLSFVASSGAGGVAAPAFDVEPTQRQTLAVTVGQPLPTVTYTATLDGVPIAVGWGVDQGNIGTLPTGPSSSAAFTPSGTTGGVVTIRAGYLGKTVERQVMVELTSRQNGPTPAESGQVPTGVAQLTGGGGVGGVGGEGLGAAVSDPSTLAALASPAGDGHAQGLAFLYPYDGTVWPRGLLAPLLMWTWATGDADAIQIRLATTSGSFSYTGTFGRPPILAQTGGKFIRMPIPQDVWEMATSSAGGSSARLAVSLTVARGGHAYGPITQTWTIAPARLSGTIYYNSYGTNLAQNFTGAVGGDGRFGGAVLSIHVGDTGPRLAAGSSGDAAECRVCHSVAASGARLVVQHGDHYPTSSAYDLGTSGTTEHRLTDDATFSAMFPDGSMALTGHGLLLPLPADGAPLPTTGLDAVVTDLGTPAFSPDGTKIAFNPLAGPGVSTEQTLYTMDFARPTGAFSGLTLIARDAAPARPGWPAFFPDSRSIVFHDQTVSSLEDPDLTTRAGAHAQIHWTSLDGPMDVTPLDQLNGKGYLPALAASYSLTCTADGIQVGGIDADHDDDADLNYEPTVNPVASGGYAWVVFTSRRMYGNEAIIPPFCSDPRGVDLIANVTPKKLWVAAVDLTQAPGVDGSHPAFYLPAQEILAGNSRGFWVLDPCKADDQSCASGDQCCNGYCEPSGPGGALVCANTPPDSTCSGLGDKCTTSAACCDPGDTSINGFCAQKSPT